MNAPPSARNPVPASFSDLVGAALARLCGTEEEETIAFLLSRAELVRIRVGDTLYRQGDPGDCLHIVLTGRLQVRVADPAGAQRIVAYPQPGDVVGEIALFSGAGRAATISALRDATLGAIARSDIENLIARKPQVFTHIARGIIARLTGTGGHGTRRSGARTFLLAPLHRSVDWREAFRTIGRHLLRFGSVLQLDAATARERFGDPARHDYGRALDACEHAHDFLLLAGEPAACAWNRICRGYADRIVLLADAAAQPELAGIERDLLAQGEAGGPHAETDLVLVHPAGAAPHQTRRWLAARRIARHHHVRQGSEQDLARVARFLSGDALGLVLAGGGARGFAHLGAIRALREAGLPIDAVGGASFGALAATGVARGQSDAESLAEHHLALTCEDPLGDYTLPVTSLVRGEHLERMLQRHLPMDIEDLWLPFFAVSSDLTASRLHVHDCGPLWRAIRASVSLPAILPPSVENGHLLVDGGILNNLPVDIMRERVHGPIVAVDLAVDSIQGKRPARVPGGIAYLGRRMFRNDAREEAPTLSRVILQVTTLAGRKEAQGARRLADLYLAPPLQQYDFLDWRKMREIAATGYRHTLPHIKNWLAANPRRQDRAGFLHHWRQARAA